MEYRYKEIYLEENLKEIIHKLDKNNQASKNI